MNEDQQELRLSWVQRINTFINATAFAVLCAFLLGIGVGIGVNELMGGDDGLGGGVVVMGLGMLVTAVTLPFWLVFFYKKFCRAVLSKMALRREMLGEVNG